MEHRAILGDGNLARRFDDRVGVGVLGAAIDRVQLVAVQLERHAQLDQRQHLAQPCLDVALRSASSIG